MTGAEVSLLVSAARRAAPCAALALSLLAPGAARAIEPGVIYEPGSPAGKEYAIPLEEARRDAGSPGGGRDPSFAPFGVGIEPPGGGKPGGGSRAGRGGGAAPAAEVRSRGAAGRAASTKRIGPRLSEAESAGSSDAVWLAGLALAVLLPAAMVALLLRGRRRPAT
jgi:hypothetical protein